MRTGIKARKMFRIGQIYRDAVGRGWKIIRKRTDGDGAHVMIVRRVWNPFRYELAFEESDGTTAIVLFDYGFTTIYSDEGGCDGCVH